MNPDPFAISMRASAKAAQTAAGYDNDQFDRFKVITAETAKQFVEKNPGATSWRSIGANVRERLRNEVNAAMAEEEIPNIAQDVFKWRMDQAIRNAVKAGK
ncbi:hypothetical protein EK21DRAFT_68666 [Setomelanomma holmii]|uniref:Uncharacterized protein n=1 Tax=Setomelanomma holmii TaxID=210430 RepID=A0A9P4H789_9PLEO|nr:hypothetical protein EK21DRAFT_68666 [Setomelanomma holmii]